MPNKKEKTVEIGKNAVRVRTHNKQVMVAQNRIINEALLIEICYCIKADEHQTVHYKKLRKNTFVNAISLKEETAIELYNCLHYYFKLKGIMY